MWSLFVSREKKLACSSRKAHGIEKAKNSVLGLCEAGMGPNSHYVSPFLHRVPFKDEADLSLQIFKFYHIQEVEIFVTLGKKIILVCSHMTFIIGTETIFSADLGTLYEMI